MMVFREWVAVQNIPEGEKHGHWRDGAWRHLVWMISMSV
jgi:hypothetical protein